MRAVTITLWNHREIYPVKALNDPQALIAQRPQAYFDTLYSAALATEEVHWVFMDYLARWLPELYALIPDGKPSFVSSLLTHDSICTCSFFSLDV